MLNETIDLPSLFSLVKSGKKRSLPKQLTQEYYQETLVKIWQDLCRDSSSIPAQAGDFFKLW